RTGPATGEGACLAVRTPPAASFSGRSWLLLLQSQDRFRLGPEAAEFFVPRLIPVHPPRHALVVLSRRFFSAQSAVGHGEKERTGALPGGAEFEGPLQRLGRGLPVPRPVVSRTQDVPELPG